MAVWLLSESCACVAHHAKRANGDTVDIHQSPPTKQTFLQVVKFITLGAINNLSSYVIYLIVTSAGVSPYLTSAVLFVVVAAASFWGNRQLTFQHTGRLSSSGFRFIVLYSVVFVLVQLILVIGYQWLGIPHQIVTIATTAISIPFMFVALKYYVFPERRTQ
jgi:putative flippase GtrA